MYGTEERFVLVELRCSRWNRFFNSNLKLSETITIKTKLDSIEFIKNQFSIDSKGIRLERRICCTGKDGDE